jgi:transcriptional regulator with XRE-family HTH domain
MRTLVQAPFYSCAGDLSWLLALVSGKLTTNHHTAGDQGCNEQSVRSIQVADDNKIIGGILKQARIEGGFSLREMAETIGCSHASIVLYEKGRHLHRGIIAAYEYHLQLPHLTLLQRVEEAIGHKLDESSIRSDVTTTTTGATTGSWELVRGYGPVLYEVTHEEPGEFSEVTRYIYHIAADNRDVVIEEHETTVSGAEALRWRHFDPGALPGSSDPIRSFEDLQLRAACDGPSRVEILPLGLSDRRARFVAFFLPPVSNDTINWRVEYSWPNLWKSLRTSGQDSGRIGFRSFTSRGEIVLIPPALDVALALTKRDPEVGTVEEMPAASGLRWSVVNPNGRYWFRVEAHFPK